MFDSKCTTKRLAGGLHPGPLIGSLSAPPDPIAMIGEGKGREENRRERKGRGRKGKQGRGMERVKRKGKRRGGRERAKRWREEVGRAPPRNSFPVEILRPVRSSGYRCRQFRQSLKFGQLRQYCGGFSPCRSDSIATKAKFGEEEYFIGLHR